jgi:hypothetical protein
VMTCTALRACARSAGVIGGLGHSWKLTISNRRSWSCPLTQAAVLPQRSHPPSQMSRCLRVENALSIISALYPDEVHLARNCVDERDGRPGPPRRDATARLPMRRRMPPVQSPAPATKLSAPFREPQEGR